MNKEQRTSATMQTKKEFDRSMCFTFYKSFHEQIMDVKRDFGLEAAFDVYEAIVNYGLYETEIEKGRVRTLVGNTTIEQIESSQCRRSRGFNKEDFGQTKLVAEYYRDHPKASERQIVDALGGAVKKTKVHKTLVKIRESGLSAEEYITDIINPNLNPNSNSTSTSYINTIDQDRDQSLSKSTELAVAQTDANAQEEEEKRELVISCFQKGMSYKKDKPEIQKATGLNGKVIHTIIQEYYEEMKENENKTLIPLANGTMSEYYIEDFNITKETLPSLYCQMVGEDSHYNFRKEFVDEWLLKEYGYKAD